MTGNRVIELAVQQDHSGERLDQFIAPHCESRTFAQRLIAAGQVTVNGAAQQKRYQVALGDHVVVTMRERANSVPADSVAVPFTTVYEDADLLVIDKPAGVVVHPGRGNRHGTLAQALVGRAQGGPDPDRPGIVHRLDKNTSGLLLVAKSETTHRKLSKALAARAVKRCYQALVNGQLPSKAGTIDAPLGRDRRVRTKVSTVTDTPRKARTHFTVVEYLAAMTLVDVQLETGRTHQIRAHFAAIEHAVVGDPEYGEAGRYGLQRQFLHAQQLSLEHPVTGIALNFHSALPSDLVQALALARAE